MRTTPSSKMCSSGKLIEYSALNLFPDPVSIVMLKDNLKAISSKVDYLINNDINSTSTKNKEAKELGIKID